jgi:hypothetical protein
LELTNSTTVLSPKGDVILPRCVVVHSRKKHVLVVTTKGVNGGETERFGVFTQTFDNIENEHVVLGSPRSINQVTEEEQVNVSPSQFLDQLPQEVDATVNVTDSDEVARLESRSSS